ncbi:MAG TPA: hypothetical protein VIZ43_00220 [Trebonia sp.]
MDQARVPGPGELRRLLREQAGLDLASLAPADGGESASTFLATGRDGTASVLKVSLNAAGDSVARLGELAARLRRRGYPAARLLASGQAAGITFWLQERLPDTVLDRVPDWLLPELLRLNDAQAGLGDGTCRLTGPITTGGDGYCVHATLEDRPDTRDLLAVVRHTASRCLPAVPERTDFVHYDFTLAHMLLRQVDWSLRHHPGTHATAHHLHLARLVAADLAARSGPVRRGQARSRSLPRSGSVAVPTH